MQNKLISKIYCLSCCFIFSLCIVSKAQKFTISGYIEDKATGEKLIGASIYEPRLKIGAAANAYGFYSITLPADTIQLIIRYIGYAPQVLKIKLSKNESFNFKLSPSNELKTVEIVETRVEKIEERSQMSTIEIPIAQIKSIPALFGEVDVLKALQLLPGVQSGGEGSSGFYVRGGGPDQNLILLDEAPVYNASHLFGFFSVFNADAINNVELIKGGFPARYGGRLSSVVEINMKEGNNKEFHGEGSVGIISSKLTVEGPIIKDKTSFIVSGRRTYIDILARPIIKAQNNGSPAGYYFYDLNAKINHKISDKDHLYLSFYTGDDKFYVVAKDGYQNYEQESNYQLGWGNMTGCLRWNHLFGPKLFANTTATYSKFKFYTKISEKTTQTNNGITTKDEFSLNYFSGINDWTGKVDFDYYPVSNHKIKFGINNIYHTFNTGATQYKINQTSLTNVDTTLGSNPIYAHESAVYIEDDMKLSEKFKANIGVHGSGFLVKNTFYKSVQPRASLRYLLPKDLALKLSYATMTQFIHLLSNSSIGLPTDLWVPSTDTVKPEFSQQIAIGLAKTIENDYEFSVEGYYKKMNNIIDYIDGANFLESNKDWQKKVEAGKGWSYGTELFIQKKKGKTTWWVGYTLSWTNRQFENINFGKPFPYKYDRRHDFEFVVSHKFSENIDFACTWVYGTGNALSLPIASYNGLGYYQGGYQNQTTVDFYGDKNSFRMASYHRLDLGVNFKKKKRYWERVWNISVYNVYSRKNPYFIYFGYDDFGNKVAKQVSLFPIIPSISYSFKF